MLESCTSYPLEPGYLVLAKYTSTGYTEIMTGDTYEDTGIITVLPPANLHNSS